MLAGLAAQEARVAPRPTQRDAGTPSCASSRGWERPDRTGISVRGLDRMRKEEPGPDDRGVTSQREGTVACFVGRIGRQRRWAALSGCRAELRSIRRHVYIQHTELPHADRRPEAGLWWQPLPPCGCLGVEHRVLAARLCATRPPPAPRARKGSHVEYPYRGCRQLGGQPQKGGME